MTKKGKRRCDVLPVLHRDAAGIDVGASELFVAVSADRDLHPVRSFPTFTRDLHVLADWLERCGIRSVAMESTSVYWIPIYQILEARGLEVYLVNACVASRSVDRLASGQGAWDVEKLHTPVVAGVSGAAILAALLSFGGGDTEKLTAPATSFLFVEFYSASQRLRAICSRSSLPTVAGCLLRCGLHLPLVQAPSFQ